MSDFAVRAHDLSKTYRVWRTPTSRLFGGLWEAVGSAAGEGSALSRRCETLARRHYRDFHSLRGVALEVRRGEALGIVGRNGAGKSTLLQIIAGTLQPTRGSIEVSGRVAALLELGSGFNPEFTGRENVVLNASLLGLSRSDLDARMDDILAYANIGEFIDQPVKTYSTGMQLRLAFAVSVHVDAEILIIDEALAVGDARFQLKCSKTLDRFREEGRTLIFVSHDLASVRRLCSQAFLLERGAILANGHPNDVVNEYSRLIADAPEADAPGRPGIHAPPSRAGDSETPPETPDPTAQDGGEREESGPRPAQARATAPERPRDLADASVRRRVEALLDNERSLDREADSEFAYGGERGRILDVVMSGSDGEPKTWFTTGETSIVRFRVHALDRILAPIYAMTLKSISGQEVYGTNTLFSRQPAPDIEAGGEMCVSFEQPLNLMAGEYFVSLGWTHFVGDELVVVHRRYDTIRFRIFPVDHTFGIANCFSRIVVQPASAAQT